MTTTSLNHGALLDACNKYEQTPLYEAAREDHRDMAWPLVIKGVDLGAFKQRGLTPIHEYHGKVTGMWLSCWLKEHRSGMRSNA